MHFAARRHGRNPRAVCALTPHARSNSRAGHASAPAEKHCAAQAEYGRLAAQAYSPSDAMSQARFCLDGMKKVQRRLGTNSPGNLPAETGPCGRRICSRGWGGPPDFPRRRRPRCIAPCGGVVWLRRGRPATSLPCRRNACRYRGRHERRSSCTAPSRPCTPEPCRIYRRNRDAGNGVSAAGVRDRAPAHVPIASRRAGPPLEDALVGKGRQRLAASCRRRLFLARWIRLPRRHMGSRRRVRPDRRRHPRGLRSAAEAQQP